MKLPRNPPDFDKLFKELTQADRLPAVLSLADRFEADAKYRHWDTLRYIAPPTGFTREESWMAHKLRRKAAHRPLPLLDKQGEPFRYYVTDSMQEVIHEIDFGAGGYIGMPDPIANPQTRDRYVVSSLIHEAITSSQLEGAVSTVEVAKEMIRTGRRPADRSEKMILNNYMTMQHIIDMQGQELTPEIVCDIHRRVTEGTLENPDAAGRMRNVEEDIRVMGEDGTVYHDPPPADELADRMAKMCDFANGKTPKLFMPPVVRAIILHFWLAYDHPFCDGNGRTARALFYWAMLRNKFWLFEFVSISNILLKAPSKYARSFLYTETDENDLNYFIISQVEVIHRAIRALHDYINRKTRELHETEARLRFMQHLNHRQQALIGHALRHPHHQYTVASHRRSHKLAYDTARTDLLGLAKLELLMKSKRGKAWIFQPALDLAGRLETLARNE